jgi:hypothetical protein
LRKFELQVARGTIANTLREHGIEPRNACANRLLLR